MYGHVWPAQNSRITENVEDWIEHMEFPQIPDTFSNLSSPWIVVKVADMVGQIPGTSQIRVIQTQLPDQMDHPVHIICIAYPA